MKRIPLAAIALLAAACETDDGRAVVGQLASDRLEITAEFGEPITAFRAAEGERVEAGALLVEQDTARIDARLREARARVAEAEARLSELVRGPREERIDAARAEVADAASEVALRELEYARAAELYEDDAASQDTLDRARAGLESARARLAGGKARLEELLEGTTVEELRQAEQRLEQAEAARAALGIDRERHSLEAPVAGLVDTWILEPGERPQPGAALLVLLAGEQPHARVYVPEKLRVRIRPGIAATVFVDGLDAPVPGRVRWVSSDAAFTPYFALTEYDRGRLSFVAEIALDYDGERLPDGVPVEAEFDLSGS